MKTQLVFISLFLFLNIISAQSSQNTMMNSDILLLEEDNHPPKIKVYLLGSFHFAGTESWYNVLDKNHQESIEELSNIITKLAPAKIFVERQPEFEFQNKIDSLYHLYLKTDVIERKNEIYQVGFRIAKKLGHQQLFQCDHPGQYGRYIRAATEYAENNGQMDILNGKSKETVLRLDEAINEDSLMQNSSLLEYIKWINSPELMETSHAFYIANLTQVGSTDFYNYDEDYTLVGAELTADWYWRNIMIYSKMINQLDYDESSIFLLIGAEHVPIIKSLFDANPYFEVIDPSIWLH